ncbi:MAG: ACP phosphodiesterase [Cytophagales bacterium]|nr:ACP phosphodiesterase [Cytophagales bacterium]
MNYLAHFYLSDTPKILLGNFLGDFVKGKQLNEYDSEIRQGIIWHREIDAFSDAHPAFRRTKKRVVPHFGHYSSVAVDLYYDHLLAKNFSNYSPVSLPDFAGQCYAVLNQQIEQMPETARRVLHSMAANDWLTHYSTCGGMQRAFDGVSKRASFPTGFQMGIKVLAENIKDFSEDFNIFFDSVRQFRQRKMC